MALYIVMSFATARIWHCNIDTVTCFWCVFRDIPAGVSRQLFHGKSGVHDTPVRCIVYSIYLLCDSFLCRELGLRKSCGHKRFANISFFDQRSKHAFTHFRRTFIAVVTRKKWGNRTRLCKSSRTALPPGLPSLDRFFWATRFLFLFFSLCFVSVPCGRLSWLFRQILSAR